LTFIGPGIFGYIFRRRNIAARWFGHTQKSSAPH
jgi:hypothetical protein